MHVSSGFLILATSGAANAARVGPGRTKSWKSQNGKVHVGRTFTKPSLYRLLSNAGYAGKFEHRGEVYPGEHAAIGP
jgi:hypothetical protein